MSYLCCLKSLLELHLVMSMAGLTEYRLLLINTVVYRKRLVVFRLKNNVDPPKSLMIGIALPCWPLRPLYCTNLKAAQKLNQAVTNDEYSLT